MPEMKKWKAVLTARVLDPVALRQQKARGRQIPKDGYQEVIIIGARDYFIAAIKTVAAAMLFGMLFPKGVVEYKVDSLRPL